MYIPRNKLVCADCATILVDLECPKGCTTQAQSYAQHHISGIAATQKERVLYAIAFSYSPLSRNKLEKIFEMHDNAPRIRLSAICGRVGELLAEGKIAVAGKTWDDETQRVVETLTVKKRGTKQLSLL